MVYTLNNAELRLFYAITSVYFVTIIDIIPFSIFTHTHITHKKQSL